MCARSGGEQMPEADERDRSITSQRAPARGGIDRGKPVRGPRRRGFTRPKRLQDGRVRFRGAISRRGRELSGSRNSPNDERLIEELT